MKRLAFILIALLSSFSCAHKQKNKTHQNIAYDKAYIYLEKQQIDSAFLFFNKAKDLFIQSEDSLGVGKCLLNMAIISTNQSDYLGGQELSLNAQAFFNMSDNDQKVYISSNLNNLGVATYKIGDYSNALKFYDVAIKNANNPENARVYLNNKATVFREQKNYPKAISIYARVLIGASRSPEEYARALCNLAITRWHYNHSYPAEKEMNKAMQIREREKDLLGLSSSYAHFSDYYAETSPSQALSYAMKMYETSKYTEKADDQLLALQKIIRLSPGETSKHYFGIYEAKQDSLTKVNSAAKNQFALIRYESEKIKTEKAVVQKDNQAKRYQIFILIFFLIGTVATAYWLSKKRKQKQALEAQNAIRLNQLRTSKKVHDVVANGLYRVMTEIENQPVINKELVLDKIEDLYEKSRDISYEQPLQDSRPYHEVISELLSSFASEDTKVLIAGNAAEVWNKVTEPCQYEVMQIIQEMMVNMRRHSGASNVLMRFEREPNLIKIYYADNGKGMEQDIKFGNGLRNTGNRIETICGQITFDTAAEKGLKIEISFPVS